MTSATRTPTGPRARAMGGPALLRRTTLLLLLLPALLPATAAAQTEVDGDQLGAWYMLFWTADVGESRFGAQGDLQYRHWDLFGDMEQLLLRAGLTFTPESAPVTFTLGGAHITTGEFGDSDATFSERRIYQEVLVRQSLADVAFLRHRYRSEQRWVDDQDLRTRYRYALFVDVPLNGRGTGEDAVYLALYDEVFINGELDIGEGRRVERFDRNRLYGGLGYGLSDRFKVQGGAMVQTTAAWTKTQLQLSLHASF